MITEVYVNTTGNKNDDDLFETVESDDSFDRIHRLKAVLEEILYDMEDEESFTIKIVNG